jgi:hypothetical protein
LTSIVKPAHVVTSIKQSPVFSCPVIWIEHLIRPLFHCPKGDLLIQVWLYISMRNCYIIIQRFLFYTISIISTSIITFFCDISSSSSKFSLSFVAINSFSSSPLTTTVKTYYINVKCFILYKIYIKLTCSRHDIAEKLLSLH